MKTQNQLSLFSSTVNTDEKKEIIILLSPPDEIKADLRRLKYEAARYAGNFEGMHSEAYISLFKFNTHNFETFKKYIPFLENHLLQFDKGIKVKISGIHFHHHFNDKNTIQAKIKEVNDVSELQQSILRFYNQQNFGFKPKIALATTYFESQFKRIWQVLEARNYRKTFTCYQLVILERSFGSNKKFNLLAEIQLGSQ